MVQYNWIRGLILKYYNILENSSNNLQGFDMYDDKYFAVSEYGIQDLIIQSVENLEDKKIIKADFNIFSIKFIDD